MSLSRQVLSFDIAPGERSDAPVPPLSGDQGRHPDHGHVTQLLRQMAEGGEPAGDLLMPLIYDELRRIARACMRRERPDNTLQPTALVHEAYLRLCGQDEASWQSRSHFFSVAAQMMRRILVDNSRSRMRQKRGHGRQHEEFVDAEMMDSSKALSPIDLLALDEALNRLAEVDRRMVQVVELRFFAGLPSAEVAQILGVSEPTVKRSWSVARAWLARHLGGA